MPNSTSIVFITFTDMSAVHSFQLDMHAFVAAPHMIHIHIPNEITNKE